MVCYLLGILFLLYFIFRILDISFIQFMNKNLPKIYNAVNIYFQDYITIYTTGEFYTGSSQLKQTIISVYSRVKIIILARGE